MGFLHHFRSKSKNKDEEHDLPRYHRPSISGRNYSEYIDDGILGRILQHVCPHSVDDTYVASEHSALGEGCMLCDMRDLAHSAQVNRRWYGVAQRVLYHSVRIDSVHYCERQLVEIAKKTKKSSRNPSALVADVPAHRLYLFCRTVRESSKLARYVEILKLAYMTRETSKAELAATVAALPQLRYVDLPDGAFTGDPTCYTLVNELQSRCPNIRKMKYQAGSELQLESLTRNIWHGLEQVELSGVVLEAGVLRLVLASLPRLRDLCLIDLPWLADSIFESSPNLPEFPALSTFRLRNCHSITATGLVTYLHRDAVRQHLTELELQSTGVTVPTLHHIINGASRLKDFSYTDPVSFSDTLALESAPLLASRSLYTLFFELGDNHEHAASHVIGSPAALAYNYLVRSLHANGLTALRTVYVRDPTFSDMLTLPPPSRPGHISSTLCRPLIVYSKSMEEVEYTYTIITPENPGQYTPYMMTPVHSPNPNGINSASRAGSGISALNLAGGRPLSAFSASRGLGPQWAGTDSVVVGNGFGGYLAVPRDEVPHPKHISSDRGTLLGANMIALPPSQPMSVDGSTASRFNSMAIAMGGFSLSTHSSPKGSLSGMLTPGSYHHRTVSSPGALSLNDGGSASSRYAHHNMSSTQGGGYFPNSITHVVDSPNVKSTSSHNNMPTTPGSDGSMTGYFSTTPAGSTSGGLGMLTPGGGPVAKLLVGNGGIDAGWPLPNTGLVIGQVSDGLGGFLTKVSGTTSARNSPIIKVLPASAKKPDRNGLWR